VVCVVYSSNNMRYETIANIEQFLIVVILLAYSNNLKSSVANEASIPAEHFDLISSTVP